MNGSLGILGQHHSLVWSSGHAVIRLRKKRADYLSIDHGIPYEYRKTSERHSKLIDRDNIFDKNSVDIRYCPRYLKINLI